MEAPGEMAMAAARGLAAPPPSIHHREHIFDSLATIVDGRQFRPGFVLRPVALYARIRA